jgi:hypothetical protein
MHRRASANALRCLSTVSALPKLRFINSSFRLPRHKKDAMRERLAAYTPVTSAWESSDDEDEEELKLDGLNKWMNMDEEQEDKVEELGRISYVYILNNLIPNGDYAKSAQSAREFMDRLEKSATDWRFVRKIRQRHIFLISVNLEKSEIPNEDMVEILDRFIKFVRNVNEQNKVRNIDLSIKLRNKIWGKVVHVNAHASNGSLLYCSEGIMQILKLMTRDDFKHLPGIIGKNDLRRHTRHVILSFLALKQWRSASELLDSYLAVQHRRDMKSMPRKVFLELIFAALQDQHSNVAIKFMRIWNSGKYHTIKETAKRITVPELLRLAENRQQLDQSKLEKEILDWKYTKGQMYECQHEYASKKVDFSMPEYIDLKELEEEQSQESDLIEEDDDEDDSESITDSVEQEDEEDEIFKDHIESESESEH